MGFKPIDPTLYPKRADPQSRGEDIDPSSRFQAFTARSRRAALADYLGSWISRFDQLIHIRRVAHLMMSGERRFSTKRVISNFGNTVRLDLEHGIDSARNLYHESGKINPALQKIAMPPTTM